MEYCLLALSLLTLLSACKPAAAPAPAASGAAVATPIVTTPALASSAPFSVQITLSEKARQRMASPAETSIVSATYFADPTPAASDQANEVGQIDMGKTQVELALPGTATFDGSALRQDRLALIQDEPQVNINVYSGRRSSPDNLLDCGIFQDTVTVAASKPITIGCKLIDEEN